ncbi:MAG: hypothetical protein H3C54_04485 [Taibaiella sp.]|nr:hypothetical protein [Taibaiella sp.]
MVSCSKYQDFGKTYIIAGHIYSAEDSTPIANTELVYFRQRTTSAIAGKGDRQSISFTTDIDGYFVIRSKLIRGGDHAVCRPGDRLAYIEECPGQFGTAVNADGEFTYYGIIYMNE